MSDDVSAAVVRTARKKWRCEARGIFGRKLELEVCEKPIEKGERYLDLPDDRDHRLRRRYCMVCAARKGLVAWEAPS